MVEVQIRRYMWHKDDENPDGGEVVIPGLSGRGGSDEEMTTGLPMSR